MKLNRVRLDSLRTKESNYKPFNDHSTITGPVFLTSFLSASINQIKIPARDW